MLTTGSSFALHPTTAPAQQQAPAAKHHFSFGDLLDIANPLQHLPVIGTLYRAITGDKIGTPEKLVGDAIYGGPWGLVSSLADTAFQSATGKNFGDTVLSLVTGKHDEQPVTVAGAGDITRQSMPIAATRAQPGAIASQPPAPIAIASTGPSRSMFAGAAASRPSTAPDEIALNTALARGNVATDTAQRALYAYRRSLHAQHPSAYGMF